ncbi:uncharacterized protein N7515_004609 [Penicillium bovifimosum]|uniref:BHLH domain-containing protein n=1 Tax=Penicillium bovifimosum TaxID=126998 RepID=A0A9W9L3M8_9EURO|nr:uncharacterized protein N7515_004609 [Penicillium bovifimosum]KAJ5135331.1 hypothetical protein N7515_004609 [Penicillium bovifimosum]
MHLTSLLAIGIAALGSTAAAMPRLSGPYHGHRIPVHVPTNATTAHNATTTGTRGRAPLSTGLAKNSTRNHGMNHVNVNHCHELCSLQSQTCSLAVPDDDAFCGRRVGEDCPSDDARAGLPSRDDLLCPGPGPQYLSISSPGPTASPANARRPLRHESPPNQSEPAIAARGRPQARDTFYTTPSVRSRLYSLDPLLCNLTSNDTITPEFPSLFTMSQLPTPAMSGKFTINDKFDGVDSLTLPPAALSPDSASRSSSTSDPSHIPASPTSPELSGRQASYTARSGASLKRPLDDLNLPPPPTRARKIIQMKPKPPTSKSLRARNTKSSPQSSEEPTPSPTSTSKRKQPSATSAAGRKNARKTAHSLIERRRRSKMNEEFSTLKDMIPACTGQEMHKLAILQASIDYVNYLEKCIRDMKTAGPSQIPAAPPSPTSPEFIAETGTEPMQRDPSSTYSYSSSASPELYAPPAQFSDTSPSFSPRTQVPSAQTIPGLPSILPSPALGPMWASHEKMHELQGVDHEASTALLMLTQDRRGTADSISEYFPGGTDLTSMRVTPGERPETQRRKGMSVRDLLIS